MQNIKYQILISLLVLILLSGQKIQGQTSYFSINGGYSLPLGDFKSFVKTGYNLSISFEDEQFSEHFRWGGTFSINTFEGKNVVVPSTFIGFPDDTIKGRSYDLINGAFMTKFYILTEKIKPYIGLDIPLGYIDYDFDNPDFGIIPNIGVDYNIANILDVRLGVRYNHLFTKNKSRFFVPGSFLDITLGVVIAVN